jgi:uncharacterized delta-60 repeat protein
MQLSRFIGVVAALFVVASVTHPIRATGQLPAPLAQPSLQLMTNGIVEAMAVAPDGSIVFGGQFSFVNGIPRTNIARLKPNGSLDQTWDPGCDGEIKSVAVGPDGAVFVGGFFYNIGGGKRSYVAKLAGTGAGLVDPIWNARADQEVDALAVDGDGSVYLGGVFLDIGGQQRTRLAKLSASGSGDADPQWNPASDDYVLALALDHQGSIYVGGKFENVAGQPRSHIAKLSTSGAGVVRQTWNAGLVYGYVDAVVVDGNQSVFIAGYFQQVADHDGTVAKLSQSNGAVDSNWTIATTNAIVAIALDGAGAIYAGGWDATIYKVATSGTGQPVAGWNVGALKGASIHGQGMSSLAVSNNMVIAGGYFTGIGTDTRLGLGVLSTSGNNLSPTDVGRPGTVNAAASQPGGGIIVGGDFYLAGPMTPRRSLLRLTPTGQLDPAWIADTDGVVSAIAFAADGGIYVGGQFSNVDGLPRIDLAKLSGSTGVIDTTWIPGYGGFLGGRVSALAVDSVGSLYAGGDFLFNVLEGRQGFSYAAKFSGVSGAVDLTWSPSPDHPVAALVIDGSGSIFIGGQFRNIGGSSRNYLAKLTGAAGLADSNWNPSPDNIVSSLILDGTGRIYTGGGFSHIGGQSHSEIARLSTDGSGTADALWNPMSVVFYYGVQSLVLSANENENENIYAAGKTFYDNQFSGAIIKASTSTGYVDLSWNPAMNGPVNAIATATDGSIYAGGAFTAISGSTRLAIAALPPTVPDKIFYSGFE